MPGFKNNNNNNSAGDEQCLKVKFLRNRKKKSSDLTQDLRNVSCFNCILSFQLIISGNHLVLIQQRKWEQIECLWRAAGNEVPKDA